MGKSLSKKSSDSKSVKRVGSGGVVLPRQHTRLLKERVEHISDFVSLPSEEDETVLGVGVNGEVILGSDKKTGRAVALKIVSKQTKHLDELRLEIDLLSQMDHPNIVKLVASYEDKVNLYIYPSMVCHTIWYCALCSLLLARSEVSSVGVGKLLTFIISIFN